MNHDDLGNYSRAYVEALQSRIAEQDREIERLHRFGLDTPNHLMKTIERQEARIKELEALEQSLVEHRIAVSPEYEGGFQAHVYGDEENPVSHGVGNSPSEAVAAAIANWSRV